jgi:uncharacterized protein (TIGR03067 family)
MSARIVMLMAVGLLIAGFGPATTAGDKEDVVKTNMKLLEGDWILQAFETDGKQIAADQIKNIKLTIAGDRYMVDFGGGKKLELTFKIDPSKKPKAMDLIMTKDDQKTVTPGIYEVSADTFKVCRPTEAGKDRPTAFTTKEGSGTAMATYKREKK